MFMSNADLGKCRSWVWTDQRYFCLEMLVLDKALVTQLYNRNYRVTKDEGTMLRRTRIERNTGFDSFCVS
jgi:hypothetical protein